MRASGRGEKGLGSLMLKAIVFFWFFFSPLTSLVGLVASLVLPLAMAHRVSTGGAAISFLLFLVGVLGYLLGLILQPYELMNLRFLFWTCGSISLVGWTVLICSCFLPKEKVDV
jgi:hypothetical protein